MRNKDQCFSLLEADTGSPQAVERGPVDFILGIHSLIQRLVVNCGHGVTGVVVSTCIYLLS